MLHVASTSTLEFHPEREFGAKCYNDSHLFLIFFFPPIIWCILEPNIYHNVIYIPSTFNLCHSLKI